jgi:hypothetical protein
MPGGDEVAVDRDRFKHLPTINQMDADASGFDRFEGGLPVGRSSHPPPTMWGRRECLGFPVAAVELVTPLLMRGADDPAWCPALVAGAHSAERTRHFNLLRVSFAGWTCSALTRHATPSEGHTRQRTVPETEP